MDIEELKKERAKAEEEIKNAVNAILLDFAKKTNLFIADVYINTADKRETVDGVDVVTVQDVTCNVQW